MKRKKLKIVTTAVCILALLFPAASFGAVKTIPDSSVIVSGSTKLLLGKDNYTAKWTGVNGKVITGANGVECLMVPVKNTASAWSYSDFLDVTFTKAGSIAGKSIDVKLHFNRMTVDAAYDADTMREDGLMAVMGLQESSMNISASNSSGMGYEAAAVYDITANIVWSDSGKTVDLPFFMSASDLDSGNEHFAEGWEAVSGFADKQYIYKENELVISGTKYASSLSGITNGDASFLKAGVYAPSTGGTFRMKYYEGPCGTTFALYNQYAILKAPVKSIQ